MTHIKIEKKIIEGATSLLKPYKYELNSVELEKEHFADFVLYGKKAQHIFGIRFLHFEEEIKMGVRMIASYDEVTELAKKVISWSSDYFIGYPAMSSSLGLLLNPKNKSGFKYDNNDFEIKVEPNEKGTQKALSVLFKKFFLKGSIHFLDRTNTLQKADFLTNNWVKKGEPLRLLTYFPHLPWQITTGIVLAKLTSNPRYDEILDVYETFVKERLSSASERIQDFKAFVEYFKKNGS